MQSSMNSVRHHSLQVEKLRPKEVSDFATRSIKKSMEGRMVAPSESASSWPCVKIN